VLRVFTSSKQRLCFSFLALSERFSRWIKPQTASLVLGTLADMTRGKSELIAENALVRHQLIILPRQIKRPVSRKRDRLLLVVLARMVRTWKEALFLVQPETLLRWHRALFRLFWKRKSQAHSRKPRLSPETISLIQEMAANNRRLRSRAHSWRVAQTGHSGEQTDHPEVYEAASPNTSPWTELENLPAQSGCRDVGL
jgi:putative transposase